MLHSARHAESGESRDSAKRAREGARGGAGHSEKDRFRRPVQKFFHPRGGRRNATWQGTVTLTDRKATQAARSPGAAKRVGAGNADTLAAIKETIPFRSALELLRLIGGALEEEENDARAEAGR